MIKKHIWKEIPNLTIHGRPAPYPVLNERAIRSTAGLLFAVWLSTMRYTVLTHDRSIMQIIVPIFWIHFMIVTLRGPTYSPIARVWKSLVCNQLPERVWAVQKRFARGIGAFMGTLMMIAVFVFHAPSYVLLSICGTCLLFMWLESAVGFCVGCKIYNRLLHQWYIPQPDHRPACPGGACELPKKK